MVTFAISSFLTLLIMVHIIMYRLEIIMKMVSFTDFRKNASSFITEVEHGETIVLLRQGKPVAEVIPYSGKPKMLPAWKKPGIHLQISGSDLSAAVLEEREEYL